MYRILSISGGGIRGILAARILAQLEERLGGRIVDHFDMIVGTSTGSIIAALLLTGKYSAKDCIRLYVKHAKSIFKKNYWSLGGLIAPKYYACGMDTCLKQYFGDMKVRNLLKPCLLPCYDTVNRSVRLYAQQDKDNSLVWEACRKSSAAPTYFPAYQNFIDGGIAVNSPALCAISEIGTIQNVFLLSVGTGEKENPYLAKWWGKIKWITPLIDCLMSSSEEMVDYHCMKLLGDNFVKLQPDLNGVSCDMDNVTRSNIVALLKKPLRFKYNPILRKIKP